MNTSVFCVENVRWVGQDCGVWFYLASPSYECVELSECEAGGCSVNLLRGNKGISVHLLWDNVPL